MKKNMIFIIIGSLCVLMCIFLIQRVSRQSNGVELNESGLACKIEYKGVKNACDFVKIDNGDMYIAYPNKIQLITSDGKSLDIVKNDDYDISSIDYYNGKLYFTSKSSVYSYNITEKYINEIMWNIPNYGDYDKSLIRVHDGSAYISVGAATNSGVVGDDNKWVKDKSFFHDISPYDITIKGTNFGKDKTGAFQPYRIKNNNDIDISGHYPGNASLIKFDLQKNTGETFAWGIRNITGMDFTNDGRIIAGVSGMEDRGLRPVKGDNDYIYEIKKNLWYGWPDYSGGDQINSPKFKGNKNQSILPIILKHVGTNPPAPLYQYKYLSSEGSVAVDANGVLSKKNSVFFYDKKCNEALLLNPKCILKEFAKFKQGTQICSIKFEKSGIIMLDSKNGIAYEICKDNSNAKSFEPKAYYISIILILIGIVFTLKIVEREK